MPSVDRGHGFPMFAVVLGAIGAVCLAFGLLGHFSLGVISFVPVLAESTVSNALILVGAIFVAFELALVLRWVQRRSVSSRSI
ncbi:MAG: hypothetical protein ACI9DC_004919 [Gammaproteobacteria bacterium]|jgi:hypothetical protein